MRVLLLCDDFYHPGDVPANGTVPLKDKGFDFNIVFDAKNFSAETLKNYPVVLLSKCDEVSQADKSSWKTQAVQQAFVDYVENGGGLLAVHTAIVAGENTQILDSLLGCKFAYHPNACPVTVQPVKPHPINSAVNQFCETDEHYRVEVVSADIDIFLASYSPPQGLAEKYETDPYNNSPAWIGLAGYTRKQGKGRVCVLTPGHNLDVWLNENFQRLLENSLNWCAGNN
jgi:type 1 glutamine amidotransferase